MTLLQILVVLAVVAAVAAVAAGVWRRGEPGDVAGADGVESHRAEEVGLPEPTSSVPMLQLPAGRLAGQDVDRLRFSTGLRGYRMDEVDQVLDRVAVELRALQTEVDELREQLSRPPDVDEEPTADAVGPQGSQDAGEP